MSAIVNFATVSALLVLAIPASLSKICSKITRAHARRQSRCTAGLPSPHSPGHIQNHVHGPIFCPQVNVPRIAVSTSTSSLSIDSLEATQNTPCYQYQHDISASGICGVTAFSMIGPNATVLSHVPRVLVKHEPSIPAAAPCELTSGDLEEDFADTPENYFSLDDIFVAGVTTDVTSARREEGHVERYNIKSYASVPRPQLVTSPSIKITSTLPMIPEENEVLEETSCTSERLYLTLRSSPFTLFGLASIAEEIEEEEDLMGRYGLGTVSLVSPFDERSRLAVSQDGARGRMPDGRTKIMGTHSSHIQDICDSVTPELPFEEEIDFSHLDSHSQSSVSVPEYHNTEDVKLPSGKKRAEVPETLTGSLSDMDDEEALAWAYSFMLRFNAAAAALAATPGYDLEEDVDYDEECRHPVSPILESIAEEDEDFSDDELFRGDEDLSSECERSWKYGNSDPRGDATPRSVH